MGVHGLELEMDPVDIGSAAAGNLCHFSGSHPNNKIA
jgi:hypothetical protein